MDDANLDNVFEAFEAQWCPERSGPRGVQSFLSKIGLEPEQYPNLFTSLCSTDVERSWMNWSRWLQRAYPTSLVNDVLARFHALPSFNDYRSLVNEHADVPYWEDVATSELEARDYWGDAIGHVFFSAQYGYSLRSRTFHPQRFLSIRFDDPNRCSECPQKFPIRGVTQIGRQRSSDPAPYRCEVLPSGNRITVATRNEAVVSRIQLNIRLLHPDYAIVQNLGKPHSVLLHDKPLAPDRPTLVKFPLLIQIPGRILAID